MRSLDELLNHDDSMIRRIRKWVATSDVRCTILPPSSHNADVLVQLQRSSDMPLGAMAYETGGILVEDGWLRFLGSGHAQLPRNLATWNEGRCPGGCLVADDVVGGFFAVNEGAWEGDAGRVYYRAPDRTDWESIGFDYEEFLQWCLTPYVADFYQNLRWESWKTDLLTLTGDACFSFSPPLWTKGGSVIKSERTVVSIQKAFDREG